MGSLQLQLQLQNSVNELFLYFVKYRIVSKENDFKMYKCWNGIYIACRSLMYSKTVFKYLIKSDLSIGKPVDMCITLL